jgi:hypothetical protein
MPIPTEYDRQLAEIDDLQAVVMIRLRTLRHAGAHHGAEAVCEALEQYVKAVKALAGIE